MSCEFQRLGPPHLHGTSSDVDTLNCGADDDVFPMGTASNSGHVIEL